MKKTIAVLMTVVMLIGMIGILAGCGDKAPAEDNADGLTVAVVVAGKPIDAESPEACSDGSQTVSVNVRQVVGSIVDG